MLSTQQKYWVFLALLTLTGLYIFEPTSGWGFVKNTVESKLDFAPWVSVKNLMAVLLAHFWWKIFIAGR